MGLGVGLGLGFGLELQAARVTSFLKPFRFMAARCRFS